MRITNNFKTKSLTYFGERLFIFKQSDEINLLDFQMKYEIYIYCTAHLHDDCSSTCTKHLIKLLGLRIGVEYSYFYTQQSTEIMPLTIMNLQSCIKYLTSLCSRQISCFTTFLIATPFKVDHQVEHE